MVERTVDLAASDTNHWAAPPGTLPAPVLAEIAVPTLVLHGTADPAFPLPHGEALAGAIPAATLIALDGVGHEVPPPPVWDAVVPALLAHTGHRP